MKNSFYLIILICYNHFINKSRTVKYINIKSDLTIEVGKSVLSIIMCYVILYDVDFLTDLLANITSEVIA